ALLVALPLACGGEEGLIQIDLVAAPGSDLLERIDSARLELSDPPTVIEAERGADGALVLELDVVAEGQGALVRLEGFDAAGERNALGLRPPLPIAPIDASITLCVGPPLALAEAPVALEPARSRIGAALLPYGVVLAGGEEAGGAPSAEVLVYSGYDHALLPAIDLPEPRAGLAVATGPSDFVYLFGGTDETGAARADAWRLDTSVAPGGLYAELAAPDSLARADAAAAYAGTESCLVAGDPPALMDAARVREIAGPPLAGAALLSLPTSLAPPVLAVGAGVGATGAALYRGGQVTELEAPPEILRDGHAAALLPDGRALIAGGAGEEAPLTSAVLYDPGSDAFEVIEDFLPEGRTGAALTATA